MNLQFRGQGALEYLLLIGGAVVVAVIVIFIIIGLAGSTENATNATIQTGLQHIQGALDGGGEETPAAGFCGDRVVDTGSDPPEQCECPIVGQTTCDYSNCPTEAGYGSGPASCINCVISIANC